MDIFNLSAEDIKEVSTRTTEIGLYTIPDIKKAKDQLFVSTIRFIPNIKQDKTFGELYFTKDAHFVNIDEKKDLNGSYDCQKSIPDANGQVKTKNHKCPLCATHFDLKNSKSVMDNENSAKIGWRQEFFTYIQVIEDTVRPELVGKIMIFRFGKKIFDKIEAQKKGVYGKKVNVFSLTHGADFRLVVKLQDDQNNYDDSIFKDPSPIMLNGKALPYTTDDSGNVSIKDAHKEKVFTYFLERERELEDFLPKAFDGEVLATVNRIDDFLRRNDMGRANESISMAGKPSAKKSEPSDEPTSQPESVKQPSGTETAKKSSDDPFDDF